MRSAGNKAFSDHIHSLSLFQGLDCEWDFPTSSSWRLYNRSDNSPIINSNNVHQESFCEPKSRSHLAQELLLGLARMNWRIMHQLLRLAWGFFSGTASFQKLLAAEWISASSSSAPSSTTSGRWSATSSPPSRRWTSTRVSGDFTIRLLKLTSNPSNANCDQFSHNQCVLCHSCQLGNSLAIQANGIVTSFSDTGFGETRGEQQCQWKLLSSRWKWISFEEHTAHISYVLDTFFDSETWPEK